MKNKKIIIFIIFLLAGLFLSIFLFTRRKTPEGILFVKTSVENSTVLINENEYGPNKEISLKTGEHKIEVKKDGYESYINEDVLIEEDKRTEIEVVLQKSVSKEEENLISQLPRNNIYYQIEVDVDVKVNRAYTIRLYATNNGHPGQDVIWLQELAEYKRQALRWILSQSVEPEKLNIKYVPEKATNL